MRPFKKRNCGNNTATSSSGPTKPKKSRKVDDDDYEVVDEVARGNRGDKAGKIKKFKSEGDDDEYEEPGHRRDKGMSAEAIQAAVNEVVRYMVMADGAKMIVTQAKLKELLPIEAKTKVHIKQTQRRKNFLLIIFLIVFSNTQTHKHKHKHFTQAPSRWLLLLLLGCIFHIHAIFVAVVAVVVSLRYPLSVCSRGQKANC
jgi:hypothetical protein